LLTEQPGIIRLLCERAHLEARSYGLANPTLGMPLLLQDNPDNDPDGDVVFGFHDPLTRSFTVAPVVDSQFLNAVRIVARRTRERGNPAGLYFGRFLNLPTADVVATATALVDRDVYGFRPNGTQPLPLAPLALLTDPTAVNPESWERQVLLPALQSGAGGVDEFFWDRLAWQFRQVPQEAPVGDGIFEMEVSVPLAGEPNLAEDAAKANGCFLIIGQPSWETIQRQLSLGVAPEDLDDSNGEFALGSDNRLEQPAAPIAPAMDDPRLGALLAALQTLQNSKEPRVWPLFVNLTSSQNATLATLQGFVAARLIRAEIVRIEKEGEPSRHQLSLTLQPCMIATGTALTDTARRHANPEVDLYNRYVCKVRLVE
jgi:hypothetical protein